MALKLKVLGQTASLTNSNITLYGVPYFMNTVISSLNICNRSSSPASFDIAFRKQGANLSSQHYFSYRTQISGNESINIPAGITLDQSDLVVVSANTSTVSFSLFGTEEKKQGFEVFPVIEYLVIAGGGSSVGSFYNGVNGRGGGAGGMLLGSFATPMTGNVNYNIIVGAGGPRVASGSDSYIYGDFLNNITAYGGGGGLGVSGGSGAGGGFGTEGQGNAGGTTGGGGAGEAGSGANGGRGANSNISGADRPYAGGGGGYGGNQGGNGGYGGGGRAIGGSNSGDAGGYGADYDGGPNSGGGGGVPGTGDGNGGSGVVILRYSNTFPIASGNTGSPTYLESNGYRIYTFTSSAIIQF
jgi:hypothetical protein